MSFEYSENILVQNSAANLLEKELGWDVVFAYNTETLGIEGTLGRCSYKEIVLVRYLRKALFENNDWLTSILCDEAVKTLLSVVSSNTLMETNKEKYKMLKDGILVKFRKPNGEIEDRRAHVFNFKEPLKNHFLAVKELKMWSECYRKRTDIVGFVNGIPLLFVELKKQNRDVSVAYTDNYSDYLDTIPHLFYFNAFIMLSNGVEAKVGTLGSKYEFFHEWKRLKEDEAGKVDLETMLRGICKKEAFMDLFENFILYDNSLGKTVKILARNHQYLGVNEAIEAYENRKLREGKLGVFWHTQGSGKSYSMVFFTEKISRKFSGSPTFIILTDRDELNRQIGETYEGCGCLKNIPLKRLNPKNGVHLTEMLKGNSSYIFTLIQKFNKDDMQPIIPDHDVVIVSDEAHRTQNGIFAENMCYLLPTASRIGFTGTPLFSYDNITERTFGSYVSVYDFKRAVDDGATVPLYYENRSDCLGIKNPEINDEMLDVIEKSDLDINQRARLERDLARDYHVLTSRERLETIAKDFVEHYCYIWTTGKAMFVCLDKVTAVKMYDLVQKFWKEKIKRLEKEIDEATQQEFMELSHKLKWMEETEMAVVVSQEQNEIKNFKEWGLDILTHREKMVKRELDKEFKEPDNPLRIVFVCAMWLTGFDVKCLSTIYLDKPLKAHTLMQTIARANRVYEGKSNGLIVDYGNVVKALRKALADYTISRGGDKEDGPTLDKEKLFDRIIELISEINEYLKVHGFELERLIQAKDFEKLSLVQEGANAVCINDETKKKFEIMARELFKLFKYVGKDDLTNYEHARKNAISAIYDQLQEKRDKSNITNVMVQLQDVVNKYIIVKSTEEGITESRRFDISKIDFERLRQEFENTKNKNLFVKDLKELVRERIEKMIKVNPKRVNYYEKYQQIIEEYNAQQDKTVIEKTFIDLTQVVNDLNEEEKRFVREGLENDEELAIYDLLLKETLSPQEIKKIKALSHKLLESIKSKLKELDNWKDKDNTKAIVSVLIKEMLWEELPESYEIDAVQQYADKVYEYVYNTYPAA